MRVPDDINILFTRYLAEETDEQENERLFNWLSASTANMHEFILYKRTWEQVSFQLEEKVEVDAVYAELLRRIRMDRSRKVRFYGMIAVAASLVLLVGISFLFHGNRSLQGLSGSECITPCAVVQQLELPDGTKVWLNAESRMNWDVDKCGGNRRVRLEGEAFFEVARDTARPFIVDAEGLEIRVLGTRFNVAAYGDDNFVETVVADGSVAVTLDGGREYRLAADGRALYDRQCRSIGIDETDAADSYAWIRGELRFKEESLAGIAKVLERHFGVEITLASDRLDEFVLTAAFEKGKGLKDILDALSLTSPMEYSQNGKHIIINLKKELPMTD